MYARSWPCRKVAQVAIRLRKEGSGARRHGGKGDQPQAAAREKLLHDVAGA
jgi:hypothetical protein